MSTSTHNPIAEAAAPFSKPAPVSESAPTNPFAEATAPINSNSLAEPTSLRSPVPPVGLNNPDLSAAAPAPLTHVKAPLPTELANPFDKDISTVVSSPVSELPGKFIPPSVALPNPTAQVPNEKRLQTYGASYGNIKTDVVLPLRNSKIADNLRSDVIDRVKCLVQSDGCNVLHINLHQDYLKIVLLLNPFVSLNSLVSKIFTDLDRWHGKNFNFTGTYCADSQSISDQELQLFLSKTKAMNL